MSKFNLNISPYYDDFDFSKDYVRVLFRPGYALQARELTQLQTILQSQISQFGDHIFQEGSQVLDGGIKRSTVDWVVIDTGNSLKSVTDLSVLNNLELTGLTSGTTAKVISNNQETDIKYLVVQYLRDGVTSNTFLPGETLVLNTDVNLSPQAVVQNTGTLENDIGQGILASVSAGVYYIDGIFTRVSSQSVFVLDAVPPTVTPTTRIGFTVDTITVDAATDITLNDNSRGTSNSGAPGANRLKKSLTLSYRDIDVTTDENFVEAYRLVNGNVERNTSQEAQYNELLDTLARRTYDESGDYSLNPFTPNIREAVNADVDVTAGDNPDDNFVVSLAPSKAYVRGYEVETFSNTNLVFDRARLLTDVSGIKLFNEDQNYGRYFVLPETGITVANFNGNFVDFNSDAVVELYDTAYTTTILPAGVDTVSVPTGTARPGELIGIARAHMFDRDTTGEQRFYIYDVKLINSLNFNDTPTISTTVFGAGRYVSTDDTFNTNTGYVFEASNVTGNKNIKLIENEGTFGTGDTLRSLQEPTSADLVLTNLTSTVLGTEDAIRSLRIISNNIHFIANVDASQGLIGTVTPAYSINDNVVNTVANFNGDFIISPDILTNFSGANQANSSFDTFEVSSWDTRNLVHDPATPANSDFSYITKESKFDIYTIDRLRDRDTTNVINTNGTASADRIGFGWASNDKVISLLYPDVHAVHAIYESTDASDPPLSISIEAAADVLNLATVATPPSPRTDIFTANDIGNIITGQTSGATARIVKVNQTGTNRLFTNSEDQLQIQIISGVFAAGETITGALTDLPTQEFSRVLDTASHFVATDSINIINNFIFDNGQRDNFFDISRIIRKDSAPAPTGQLLIVYSRFDRTVSSTAVLSTADTYSGNLDIDTRYSNFPVNLSNTLSPSYRPSGQDLRDAVDYRQIFDPVVADSNITRTGFVGTANPNFTEVSPFFTGASLRDDNASSLSAKTLADLPIFLPTANLDYLYDHYLPRIDIISAASSGDFVTTKGTPSLRPEPKPTPSDSMLLNYVSIPPYTRYIDDITVEILDNRRYTMRDIGDLDKRIKNVEEATVLSLLESKAQQTPIFDAAGTTARFKTGFVTDDFSTLFTTAEGNRTTLAADADSDLFSASFDKDAGTLNPRIAVAPINLVETSTPSTPTEDGTTAPAGYVTHSLTYGTGSEVVKLAMLNYTTEEYIKQSFASSGVLINPFGHWKYIGVLTVDPPMDKWRESDTTRYQHNFFIEGTNNIISQVSGEEFIAAEDLANVTRLPSGRLIQNFNETKETQVRWTGTRRVTDSLGNRRFREREISSGTEFTITRNSGQEIATKKELVLGKFIEPETIAWIRPRVIAISAINMKPNARVSALFDNKDITNRCIQYLVANNKSAGLKSASGNLITDIDGAITMAFAIEYQEFNTGTRSIVLRNDAMDTQANGTYTASGERDFFVTKLTRTFGAIQDNVTIGGPIESSRTIRQWQNPEPRRERENTNEGRQERRPRDPIAQSFFVQETNDIFITGVDVYFHTVDGESREKTAVEREAIIVNQFGLDLVATTVSGTDTSGTVNTKLTTAGIAANIISEIVTLWDANTTGANTYVEFEIRNMENGYPGGRVIEESKVRLEIPTNNTTSGDDNTIYLTSDASIPTKVRFEAPIQLDSTGVGQYCFVLLSPNNNHQVWVATSGESDIGTGNTINKAPYIGSFFKSENAVTWIADPTSDMKFTIHKARFSTVAADLTMANAAASPDTRYKFPGRDLTGLSIRTFATGDPEIGINGVDDGFIRIATAEPHGMYGSNVRVKLSGVTASQDQLFGLPVGNINTGLTSTGTIEGTDFHIVRNATTYTFDIDLNANNTGTAFAATESNVGGSENVVITGDIVYDVLRPNITLISDQNGFTDVDQRIRTKFGTTPSTTPITTGLPQAYGSYDATTLAGSTIYPINEDVDFSEGTQFTRVITNDVSDSNTSIEAQYTMTNNIGGVANEHYTPVLQITDAQMIAINNLVNNDDEPHFSYVTKEIEIQAAAAQASVIFDADIDPDNVVEIFIKTAIGDEDFNTKPFVKFAEIVGITSNSEFIEYNIQTDINPGITGVTHTALTLNDFTRFAIRITGKATNSSQPPRFRDLRIIATL